MKLLSKGVVTLTLSLLGLISFGQQVDSISLDSTVQEYREIVDPIKLEKVALDYDWVAGMNELAAAGEIMQSYTRQKGWAYGLGVTGVVGLSCGLSIENDYLIGTSSLILASSILTFIHADVKVGRAGKHLIKAKIYLNPGYLRIQW